MTTRFAGMLWKTAALGLLLCTPLVSQGFGAVSPAPEASVYRIEPGSRALSDPRAYDISYGVRFTPPPGAKLVRIWLAEPPNTEDQFVINFRSLTPPTAEGIDPINGNHLLCYEYRNPTEPVAPRLTYTVVKYASHWTIDPAKVGRPKSYPHEFDKYLRSEQKIAVDENIRTLARQIAGDETNPYLITQRFFNWIIDNIHYGHEDMGIEEAGCTLQADSRFVYENRRGHCSDWHGFFIALCRSVGIPARLTYGFETSEKKRVSPSHCRAEVFLVGYGWVNMDITHARNAKTPEERLEEYGYISNDWYLATRGTDYPFVPATRAPWPGSLTGHNPPLIRMAYIEVDGQAWPDPDPANPKYKGHLDQLNYQLLWDFHEVPVGRALTAQQAVRQ